MRNQYSPTSPLNSSIAPMASSVFLIMIPLFITFLPPTSSVLVLQLTHSLSSTQFNTTHHLLKATAARSAARFHHHFRRHLSSAGNHRQVSLPLSSGSDYTLSLTLGSNPPQSVSLYMDTGSDLVWFPCSPFECILCDGKPEPEIAAVNTSSVSTVSCQSASCAAAHSSLGSADLCAISSCPLDDIETSDCDSFACPPFYYAYGDGSFVARLYSHAVSMQSLVFDSFTFGCAHTALGEPIGVAGFGRGVLSLPAQLSKLSPQLGNRFSYCLVSHSFDADKVRRPSPLILGRSAAKDKNSGGGGVGEAEFVYTEMLNNPKHPYFYSVGLEGISVGKKYITAAPNLKAVDGGGNGGMVVDSGTTFTMLPTGLYSDVVAEFSTRVGRVHKRAKRVEEKTGLGPCYYFDGIVTVPTVSLDFVGNGSAVVLPRKNYFYDFVDGGDELGRKRKVGCLMLMDGGDDAEYNGGPAATLGNYQQQGFEVVYDLEEKRIGFARRHCGSLWDSLNRR